MKYRIKTITYKDGSVKYQVEFKYSFITWYILNELSQECCVMNMRPGFKRIFESREECLSIIDKHYNNSTQSIQIEYINK